MFEILGTLFVGLIVGFIARALKPGDDKLGFIMTAILGVAGSFLASRVLVPCSTFPRPSPYGGLTLE